MKSDSLPLFVFDVIYLHLEPILIRQEIKSTLLAS